MITLEALENWFIHHPPKDDEEIAKYVRIRQAGRDFAKAIWEITPVCADQTAAIRKVREAVMTANVAIACHVEDNVKSASEDKQLPFEFAEKEGEKNED